MTADTFGTFLEQINKAPDGAAALLEALAHTAGYAVVPVKKRQRKHVDHLPEAEEYRLELYFTYDAAGRRRVHTILAFIDQDTRVTP